MKLVNVYTMGGLALLRFQAINRGNDFHTKLFKKYCYSFDKGVWLLLNDKIWSVSIIETLLNESN